MENNNITFSIASKFDGEGFKLASQAIKENQKEIRSSVTGLGELKTAFHDISPKVEKATEWVAKFGSSFTTGGIVGGVIALAMHGLSEAIVKVKEKIDEAKKASAEYAEILKERLIGNIDASKQKFAELQEQIKQANDEADDLLRVLNGNAAHEAANQVFQANVEKLNAMSEAMSETERGIAEAAGNYKIALIKAEEKQTEANNAVETYKEKLDSAGELKKAAAERVEEADDNFVAVSEKCKEYLDKRAMAENYLEVMENDLKDGQKSLVDVLQARKQVALKIEELENTYKDDVAKLKAATDEQKAARDASKAVEIEYERIQDKLNIAVQKRQEAQNDLVIAEKEGQLKVREAQDKHAKAMESLAEKEQEATTTFSTFLNGLKVKMDESQTTFQELVDEFGYLTDTSKTFGGKMKEAGDSLEDWLNGIENQGTEDGEYDPKAKGREDVRGYRNVMVKNPWGEGANASAKAEISNPNVIDPIVNKPRKLDNETWERIQNGSANVADYARAKRFQEMENRYRMSEMARVAIDFGTFTRNLVTPEAWLSRRDKEFNEMFKQYVAPQISQDMAVKLVQEAQEKLVTPMSLERVLTSPTVLNAYFSKLGLK